MTLNKMSLHGPMYFFKSRNFDQSHPSFRGEIDQSYIDIELSYSDANGVRLIIILCFKKEIKVSSTLWSTVQSQNTTCVQ